MIIEGGQQKGQLRTFIEVTDCRMLMGLPVLGKFPTRYFEAAIDFRWTHAPKIISPGQPPQQDKLSIGIIAAEELDKDTFAAKIEEKAIENIINEANKIINPISPLRK
jgi:hypothetical protein